MSYDKADIDAYLAYILWNSGKGDNADTYIEGALEGRSNILFELFGLPYNANISTPEFIEQAKKKEGNA